MERLANKCNDKKFKPILSLKVYQNKNNYFFSGVRGRTLLQRLQG